MQKKQSVYVAMCMCVDKEHISIHTCITLHYITLFYITLPYITWQYIVLPYITLQYITFHEPN